MRMHKNKDFIEELAIMLKLPKNKTIKAVDTIFDVIVRALREGEQVSIAGFGIFRVKEKNIYTRNIGNLKNNPKFKTKTPNVVHFRPSKPFKKIVNPHLYDY